MKTTILINILLVFTLFSSSHGVRRINGNVIDGQGGNMPGVTIVIKGTNRGCITDINGNFQIEVLRGDKYLVFSFVGMVTQKIKIGTKTNISVTMKPAIMDIDEAVISVDRKKENRLWQAVSSVRTKGAMKHSYYMSSGFTPPPPPNFNTENYSTINENGFKNVLINPLSTFSIDVDNASYSNVRRFINQGEKPFADAVRVEEMINYFTYNYPEPGKEHPFSITSELSACPWNSDHQLLHIGLKGKRIKKENLPPSNIVFLLDVSGSMDSYNKLPLVKKAFSLLVNEFRPSDRIAIVVYAGAVGKILDSTPGNKKQKIMEAIGRLNAGGSTAGGEGLKLAYKIASENFIEGGNNRIILATDGDFNVGISSTSEMERLVEKERENGVFITVLGFGMRNIKDHKMETIADKGNGNYAYIDNIQEARKVFITEFGATLFTIAKDVKFQLEFNPQKVKSYRLVGYENRLLNDEDFNDDTKDAGEMGAGHTVTALYEIIAVGSDEEVPSVDPLKYQDRKIANNKISSEIVTIKLRYKQPDGDKSKLFETVVSGMPVKFNNTSNNFKFSAAVASFGMILRESEYLKNMSIETILELAKSSKGEDTEGYRSEFIQLVKMVDELGFVAAE